MSASKREGKPFDLSLMDFADSITPESMEEWSAAVAGGQGDGNAGGDSEKKPVGIYDLLGLAVGCIGMSREDFCGCCFDEFEGISKAWCESRI